MDIGILNFNVKCLSVSDSVQGSIVIDQKNNIYYCTEKLICGMCYIIQKCNICNIELAQSVYPAFKYNRNLLRKLNKKINVLLSNNNTFTEIGMGTPILIDSYDATNLASSVSRFNNLLVYGFTYYVSKNELKKLKKHFSDRDISVYYFNLIKNILKISTNLGASPNVKFVIGKTNSDKYNGIMLIRTVPEDQLIYQMENYIKTYK